MSAASDPKQYLAALGRVPSGLFVLTARSGGDETGVLTSWVQQCSFEPPQVTVALKQGRDVSAWLTPDAAFVLNVLDDTQTDMIAHFGRGFDPGQPAFTGLEVGRSPEGLPVLSEALAYLECRVTGRCTAGDHDLVIGRVVGGRMLNEGQPMVHIRKSGTHY
ncbi:MAG TPA: flavin reductase family protein [Gemmataceae bacterium]|nr:flavin reductase family protein [Gemmataceae bacterium]